MLQAWGESPEPVAPQPLERSGQAGLLAAFVGAIATGTTPDTAAADNIHSLEIVFAAVESTRTGQAIVPGQPEG